MPDIKVIVFTFFNLVDNNLCPFRIEIIDAILLISGARV